MVDNGWRTKLYEKIIPLFIEEDQKHGVYGVNKFWNDPLTKWNDGTLWNATGLKPIIQNLFFAVEYSFDKNLKLIDDILDIVNPDKAPERFLDLMAISLGFPFPNMEWSVERKRAFIKSIAYLNKIRGTHLSWEIFFKIQDVKINPIPLHKKDLFEDQDRYSRTQYVTNEITNELLANSGSASYVKYLQNVPVLPGTVRLNIGTEVLRDIGNRKSNGFGDIISKDGVVGTINYANGKISLNFETTTTSDILVTYRIITDEFPYKAARVDLEFFYIPDPNSEFGGPVNATLINKILSRVEEVKPIQVLIRALVIVSSLEDNIEKFASDSTRCGSNVGKDVREDDFRLFLVDQLKTREKSFLIDTGTEKKLLPDTDEFKMPIFPDTLEITQSP